MHEDMNAFLVSPDGAVAFRDHEIDDIVPLGGVKASDGVDGQARLRKFLASRYGLPGDDLSQPISWVGAARLARVNVGIGLAVGDGAARPQ